MDVEGDAIRGGSAAPVAIQLGRRLGRGGAGEVFEAEWPGLGQVAAKLIAPAAARDPGMLARARTEARALARVRHRHVVRLLGVGAAPDGRFAIAMPRLVGRTLRQALDSWGSFLGWRHATEIVVAVLRGLAAAHSAGVLHRDLKPSNVFLGREATEPPSALRPIVIDLGLARLDGRRSEATTGASVVGSPAYVAPEQVLGGAQDARTDVYSAGVVLFELLTGAPPFVGVDPAMVLEAQVLGEPPPIPAALRVPAPLARRALRALRKAPAERYPSATAFADELEEILARGARGGRS